MKKILLIMLLWAVAFTPLAAQQYYSLTTSNEPYNDLWNPQVINNHDSIASSYHVNVNSTYELFGEQLSPIFTVGRNGFVFCGNQNYFMPVAPSMAFLKKRDSSSSVSWKNEDNTLKIQWKNMGLEGHSDSDFVNFQLWLYAGQPRIEFRYGPSRATDTTAFSGNPGPDIILSMFNSALTTAYEYHHLVGDPDMPTDDTLGSDQSLSNVPAEGTVYRFMNITTGVNGSEEPFEIKIYPNPSKDFIRVNGVLSRSPYEISDLSGRIVGSGLLDQDEVIDLSTINNGVYFIKILAAETVYSFPFIKKN